MATVPLFGQAARSGVDPVVNPAALINLYPEPVPDGGRSGLILRSAVGLSSWVDTGVTDVAALFPMDDALFAVAGDKVFRMDADGGIGEGPAVQHGDVAMSRNGNKLTVTSGGKYYLINWPTVTQPAAGAFSDFGSATFIAGRTVLTERGGKRVQWSGANDPGTLDGLNFGLADQRDDDLVRGMNVSGALMLFGDYSTEIWSATGAAGPEALALIPGAVRDTGLAGFNLVAPAAGAAFLVGNDGIAYIAAGTEWRAVSPPPVNRDIEAGTARKCVYWEDGGHKFCSIVFSDRPAWVYDLVTGLWHRRAEGRLDGAWRVSAAATWADGWYFGATDGLIYRPVRDGSDVGGQYYRRATSIPVTRDGNWFGVSRLAVGSSNGGQVMDEPAQLLLEVSRDGATFGRSVARDIGFDGDWRKRAEWRALGRAKQMVFRLTMASPCDFALWSDAEIEFA
jgi:hypothetical protein